MAECRRKRLILQPNRIAALPKHRPVKIGGERHWSSKQKASMWHQPGCRKICTAYIQNCKILGFGPNRRKSFEIELYAKRSRLVDDFLGLRLKKILGLWMPDADNVPFDSDP